MQSLVSSCLMLGNSLLQWTITLFLKRNITFEKLRRLVHEKQRSSQRKCREHVVNVLPTLTQGHLEKMDSEKLCFF